ncbi:MAG: aldehyde dehydrogenase family protein, partial [Campylobacterales bacterium]|nr:aldehyde dehydrogenase family protein [Campylobacterales bacterium]
MTELFGPVLSVMKAKDLKEAIEIVNMTGYGLTSGIESLDIRETDYWKENLKAGNLYINRGTTGAIVLRQPFGGMGKSAVGAGRKAGVHNYITQFMNYKEVAKPYVEKTYSHPLAAVVNSWVEDAKKGVHESFASEFEKLQAAVQSYLKEYENEFSKEHDYFKIRGEDNIFRYLPLSKVALRVCKDDSLFDVISRVLAAKISKVNIHISIDAGLDNSVVSFLFENKDKLLTSTDSLVREDEESFIKLFNEVERIIYSDISKVSENVFSKAAKAVKYIVRQQPMMDGRLELLNYYQEQSISHSYHRYGNLGARGL